MIEDNTSDIYFPLTHLKDMAKINRWEDHYGRQAKKDKWFARSVYKLEEIDKKYNLLRPGSLVLDLGCNPGSWSQYCLKKIGENGEVIGIDLKSPKGFSFPNFKLIQADILNSDIKWLTNKIGQRDLVLSDMAPKTTGVSVSDASRSLDLAQAAFEIAMAVLKKHGHFLCKIFECEELKSLKERSSTYFRNVRLIRPQAVRKGSREIYLLGRELI